MAISLHVVRSATETAAEETQNNKKTARQLALLDQSFKKFEKDFISMSLDDRYNGTVALIHSLIIAIKSAFAKGWTVDSIRASLPNTWRIHRGSDFGRHIQDWPRGYPGDFEIVNQIVDRTTDTSINTMSGMICHYGLNCIITQQHREKLNAQANAIMQICREQRKPVIVSIACGPSRDIELCQKELEETDAKVILIDFDQDAINESRKRLSAIGDRVETMVTNVREMPKLFKKLSEKNGKFDLVYAGGLFDYLPDGIIRILVNRLAEDHIKPDGMILFTNIANGNPFKVWIEVMGNWRLIERSEEEMKNFLALTYFKTQKLEHDPTGLTWIASAINK